MKLTKKKDIRKCIKRTESLIDVYEYVGWMLNVAKNAEPNQQRLIILLNFFDYLVLMLSQRDSIKRRKISLEEPL